MRAVQPISSNGLRFSGKVDSAVYAGNSSETTDEAGVRQSLSQLIESADDLLAERSGSSDVAFKLVGPGRVTPSKLLKDDGFSLLEGFKLYGLQVKLSDNDAKNHYSKDGDVVSISDNKRHDATATVSLAEKNGRLYRVFHRNNDTYGVTGEIKVGKLAELVGQLATRVKTIREDGVDAPSLQS